MGAVSDTNIPLLTDVVAESDDDAILPPRPEPPAPSEPPDMETIIAELQTKIASQTFALTDELMRAAFAEMEANIFRQITSNLRQELPELIDSVIREHLAKQEQE
jgi:hypothetical protein